MAESQSTSFTQSSKTSSRASAIANAYRDGKSAYRIAFEHGISSTAVYQGLRLNGVRIRPHSESNRRYKINEKAFDEITEASAYWAGFLMADGCVSPRSEGAPKLQVAVAAIDAGHLEKFRMFLESDYKVANRKNQGYPSAYFIITCKRITDRLAEFGVVPRKSLIAEAKLLQTNRHFWRGVIDGDGSLAYRIDRAFRGTMRRPHLQLFGAKPLLTQFADFVEQSGFKRPSVYVRGNYSQIHLSSLKTMRLVALLYDGCTVALDRKLFIARQMIDAIPTRKHIVGGLPQRIGMPTDDVLISAYVGGASSIQLANKYGTTKRKILCWLRRLNVKRRSLSEARRLCLSRAR